MAQEIVVGGNINLDQFLKVKGIIESGGQARWFLRNVKILISGARETCRGRKLGYQDCIDISGLLEDVGSFLIIHQGEQ